jgi:hypothetical protein
LPETVAVPTDTPPVEQLVGALVAGPKTLTVIVPVEFVPDEPASTEVMEPAAIFVPIVPVDGPVAVTVGDALPTTVSVTEGHVLTAEKLFASPP